MDRPVHIFNLCHVFLCQKIDAMVATRYSLEDFQMAINLHFETASEAKELDFARPPRTRLLLVDDDQQQLELCALVLRTAGFKVMTAWHAQEALSILEENAMDIAILDYEMPGMNGCELANAIRMRYGNTRIVLYSGSIGIPGGELRSVDAFVSKGNGPVPLIGQILELGRESNGTAARAPEYVARS
jgi:CheY-like chemotaxis protein